MKVIRDEKGMALGTFAGWEAARVGARGRFWVGTAGSKRGGCWRRTAWSKRGGWWPPCRGTGPALTGGQAEYWCRKALREGLRHLQTGQARFKTIRPRRTAGTAEPRVPPSGKDGNGMVAPQPRIKYGAGFIDTAPKARPHQPNHLNRNATNPLTRLAPARSGC